MVQREAVIVGATITVDGTKISVKTDKKGNAKLPGTGLPTAPFKLKITPDPSQLNTIGPAGPGLARGASPPTFLFRPFDVTASVDVKGFAASPAPAVDFTPPPLPDALFLGVAPADGNDPGRPRLHDRRDVVRRASGHDAVTERMSPESLAAILSIGLLLGCERPSEGARVSLEAATGRAGEPAVGPAGGVDAAGTDASDSRSGESDGGSASDDAASAPDPLAALRACLPAVRADRAVVAALLTTDDSPRNDTLVEMQIIDVASDRLVDTFQVSGPFEVRPRHPPGTAVAMAYLASHPWLPLTPMTIDEDRGAPAHKTDPLVPDAQSRANQASSPEVTLRYREPVLSIETHAGHAQRTVPRWSGKPPNHECPAPWGSIGSAWAREDAGVAIVEVTYQGFQSDVCLMADSTIHAFAWK